MDIIIDPNSASFSKKYVISTGGDYEISADGSSGRSVPGLAVYHLGLDLVAVVSTGEDVWELKVRGPVYNKTWQSVGIRWVQPNLDETVTLFPEERGGLDMFVNLEKVGQSLMPLTRPGYQARDDSVSPATPEVPGAWTVLPPAAIPAKDPSGTPMIGKTESPIMTFGCHYNQLALTPKFDYFNEASLDEVAIWTRQLECWVAQPR